MTIRSIFRWVKWLASSTFVPATCKGNVYASIIPTGNLYKATPAGSLWASLTPTGEVYADELG